MSLCVCVHCVCPCVSCSIALKLTVAAGGTGGQVIAGLKSPVLQFIEIYHFISVFPSQTTAIF